MLEEVGVAQREPSILAARLAPNLELELSRFGWATSRREVLAP
jgi:hypothetical protein